MCCGGGGGQKERGTPVGGRSARGSRWCAEDRGPRVERENQPRILHRNGERKREGEREKGGGHVCLDAALSQKHCYRQSRYKDGE